MLFTSYVMSSYYYYNQDTQDLYLKVMISKLPVWSRAIIIASSLASEPLLVRYIT